MERCGYLATLISLSIGAENSDLRNTKHSGPQIGVGDHYILHSAIFFWMLSLANITQNRVDTSHHLHG